MTTSLSSVATAFAFGLLVSTTGCRDKPSEPEPPSDAPAVPPKPVSQPKAAAVRGLDPMGGKFTLTQALDGLPAEGTLMAEIATSKGKVQCELLDDKAPVTVANFVGLARGLRPFKDKGQWVTRPAYDGLTFHRVIKGFMIQGGDPTGRGNGEPGYVIPDEIWEGASHDRRGLLCMANRGKNTNGMQFFITDGAAPHLDRGYTIFGICSPDDTIEALASVEVRGDRAVVPPTINSVTISRQ